MTTNACANALVRRLAADGGWVSRQTAAQGIGYSDARVDDELADLVVAGMVVFNERGREYKLAGTPLARRALRRLIEEGPTQRRVVLGGQSKDKARMQFGIALRVPDADGADGAELLVMAELEFDYPKGPDAMPRMFHNLASALLAAP